MGKLTGRAYLNYWNRRAHEEGPRYVGSNRHINMRQVEQQADDMWIDLRPHMPETSPQRILEYGCGWGRMLERIAKHYTGAHLIGVELVHDSVKLARQRMPEAEIICSNTVPNFVAPVDLVYTCTCLQHITDNVVWESVAEGINKIIKPGGMLVMLERMQHVLGKRMSSHMQVRSAQEYREIFSDFVFDDPVRAVNGGHVMAGVKAGADDETKNVLAQGQGAQLRGQADADHDGAPAG